jgi:hypothetical protein
MDPASDAWRTAREWLSERVAQPSS